MYPACTLHSPRCEAVLRSRLICAPGASNPDFARYASKAKFQSVSFAGGVSVFSIRTHGRWASGAANRRRQRRYRRSWVVPGRPAGYHRGRYPLLCRPSRVSNQIASSPVGRKCATRIRRSPTQCGNSSTTLKRMAAPSGLPADVLYQYLGTTPKLTF